MQRIISEIFLPIVQVMQQKDAEAHPLTMQQKRKEEIRKREAEEAEKEKQRNEVPEVADVHDGDIRRRSSRTPMLLRSAGCARL